MSKLLNYYNELKKKDCEKIYVFKVGAFYNCINEDAKKVSENIGLKLTNLSDRITKCGFPVGKLDKYTNLLDSKNLKYEVIPSLAPTEPNISYESIIKKIENIDLNNTTCKEAFDLIYNIQQNLKTMQ